MLTQHRSYPDKLRGVLNEGGLFGEREGWHLPGFDASAWEARELSGGLPDGKAGVGFFVTTFELDVPEDTDVLASFQFEETLGQPYRALLFVNGWQFGKVRTGRVMSVYTNVSDCGMDSAWRISGRSQSSPSRLGYLILMERSELP